MKALNAARSGASVLLVVDGQVRVLHILQLHSRARPRETNRFPSSRYTVGCFNRSDGHGLLPSTPYTILRRMHMS